MLNELQSILARGTPSDGASADWEKWISAEDNVPLVVKVAMGHYQFEVLHS